MIVLDTNVVSEAMKPAPDPMVKAWLNKQVAETLYLTSVSLAELLYGIASLPEGRRKQSLKNVFDEVAGLFGDRILAFDATGARCHAELAIAARNAGKGLPTPDGYIAAIAASKGFAVATRDKSPFEAAGIAVIDPWNAP